MNRFRIASLAAALLSLALGASAADMESDAARAETSFVQEVSEVPPQDAAAVPAPAVASPEDAAFAEDQRPAKLLSRDADHFAVENVRWDTRPDGTHQWDTAAIDASGVEDAYWAMEDAGVGHVFLVFEFQPGSFSSLRPGAAPSRFLVVSVEARLKKGQTYSAIKGEFGAYKSQVWNLSTLEDYVKDDTLARGASFGLYEFHVSRLQREAMVILALTKAQLDHASDEYNTLGNNCDTNALAVYNAVVNPQQAVHTAIPLFATRRLLKNGEAGPKIPFTPQDPTGHGLIALP